MLHIKDKFAVLIMSCDKYSDLWEPFFKLFWRFWPDCPFNVYLLSNKVSTDVPQVKNLLVGYDISWSDSLHKGVVQLKEEYVFLFLNDYFLYDFVKTNKVLNVFNWIIESNANYVRMRPSPKPDKHYNDLVGVVSKGTIYRASAFSVWEKDILLNLLKPGESGWDFEVYGSVRSDSYDGFYSIWENYFSFIHGVIKGKWQRNAVRKLKSFGVDINLTKRDRMTLIETVVLYLRQQRLKLLKLFPAKYRRNIKDFVRRGKYNYKLKI